MVTLLTSSTDRLLGRAGLSIALGLIVTTVSAAPSQAATLYNKTNLITNVDSGLNGADVSQLPLNATTFGFNASNGLRLAQSFTIANNESWSIDSIGVMAYLSSSTGAQTTSPFTGISVTIWNQAPGLDGSLVRAASATLASTNWTGIYRTPNGTANLTNSQRPIMNVTAAFSNLTLNSGTYWVDYAVTAQSASGLNAFSPYLLNTNSAGIPTGNARQFNGLTWSQIATGNPSQGISLPLTIIGNRSTTPTPTIPNPLPGAPPTNAIPSPALLPGLIGFGIGLWKRRGDR